MKMIHFNIILGLNIMENMLVYVRKIVQNVNIGIFGEELVIILQNIIKLVMVNE